MDVANVLRMYKKLIVAGLKPPFNQSDDKAVMGAADGFMREYPSLDNNTLEDLGNRLAHSRHWPTYFDIDEVLREFRRQNESSGFPGDLMAKARKHGPPKPKTAEEYQQFIEQTADRWFPEADKSFKDGIIQNCRPTLYEQGMHDRTCACCIGGIVAGERCKDYGHKHFLQVVTNAVEPLVYCNMNIDKCEKWHNGPATTESSKGKQIGSGR